MRIILRILILRPLNRDYTKDPNIKALKRRGFINHGSTLQCDSFADLCTCPGRNPEMVNHGLRVRIFLRTHPERHGS